MRNEHVPEALRVPEVGLALFAMGRLVEVSGRDHAHLPSDLGEVVVDLEAAAGGLVHSPDLPRTNCAHELLPSFRAMVHNPAPQFLLDRSFSLARPQTTAIEFRCTSIAT